MSRRSDVAAIAVVVLLALGAAVSIVPARSYAQQSTSLVVGMTVAPDVTDLNPMRNVYTYYVNEAWLSMVGWTSNGTLVPQLASSWTISTNGTVFTFYLRDGLKWSDGQPLTSADVNFSVYTLAQQSILDGAFYFAAIEIPDSAAPTGYTIAPGSVTLPNSTVVVFHLPGPSATFLEEGASAWIIPEHTYQGFNFTAQNPDLSTLVGSGPFLPRSYTPGSELDEVANPYYYGGAPNFSNLIFKYFTDSTAAELALESGSINLLEAVPPTDVSALSKVSGISIGTQEDQSNIYMVFNVEPTVASGAANPVSNLLVRQAIAMALDINGILNASLGAGHYILANQIEVPNMLYYGQKVQNTTIPSPEYPQNVTAAENLLNQAGFPVGSSGTRFTLTLIAPSGGIGNAGTGPTTEMLQLIQSELSNVGIEVQIIIDDATTYNNAAYGVAPPKAWNLQLSVVSESPEADVAPFFMVSSLSGNAAAGGFNSGTYNSTLVNQLTLLEENTTNPAQRIPILQRIAGIVHQDLPLLELYYQIEIVAYNSNIKGLQFGLGEPAYDYWGNLKPSSLAEASLSVPVSTTTTSSAPVSTTFTSTSISTATSTATVTVAGTNVTTTVSTSGLSSYAILAIVVVVVIVIAIAGFALSRTRKPTAQV